MEVSGIPIASRDLSRNIREVLDFRGDYGQFPPLCEQRSHLLVILDTHPVGLKCLAGCVFDDLDKVSGPVQAMEQLHADAGDILIEWNRAA
jgi:hypothetical protein